MMEPMKATKLTALIRESGKLDRIPEAMKELDARLEKQLGSLHSSKESDGRSQASLGRSEASGRRTQSEVPTRSRLDDLKERVARRGEAESNDKVEQRRVQPRNEETYLSSDAQKRLAFIEAGTWEALSAWEEARMNEEGKTSSSTKEGIWFDRGSIADDEQFDHRPFSELFSLTPEARESAAPHVRDVYESVFMKPEPGGELAGLETARGVRVVLQARVPWSEAVREGGPSMGWIEGRTHIESGLVTDMAHALDVPRTRIRIASLHLKGISCEVHVLPDPYTTATSSCLPLAKTLCAQASTNGSFLRSTGFGGLLIGGEVRDVAPKAPPVHSDVYAFSMLHGGFVVKNTATDDHVHGTRHLNNAGGQAIGSHRHAAAGDGSDEPSDQRVVSFRAQGVTLHAHQQPGSARPNSTRAHDDDDDAHVEEGGGVRGRAERDAMGFWIDATSGKPMGLTPQGGLYGSLQPVATPRSTQRTYWVWGVAICVMVLLGLWAFMRGATPVPSTAQS